MDITVLGLVFFISLFLGSFYNVVGLRTLTGENMVSDRSECVFCKHELSFLDLFPVFSYLFLGGKCRYCKEKISFIYPFGELLTAIAYTLIISKFGFSLEGLIQLVFIIVMIISTITDLKEQIVPNQFIVIGIIGVLALRLIFKIDILSSLLGGLGAFGVLYLVYIISEGRMGGADVKIYGLIGLAIGFIDSMLSLFYASCVALVVSLIVHRASSDIGKVKIPFIPFITIGVLMTYYLDLEWLLNIFSF